MEDWNGAGAGSVTAGAAGDRLAGDEPGVDRTQHAQDGQQGSHRGADHPVALGGHCGIRRGTERKALTGVSMRWGGPPGAVSVVQD